MGNISSNSENLEMKLLQEVCKLQNSTRFRCNLCRENFAGTRTFHNHTTHFHNIIDFNDSCTRAFLSIMAPSISLQSISNSYSSILADDTYGKRKQNFIE